MSRARFFALLWLPNSVIALVITDSDLIVCGSVIVANIWLGVDYIEKRIKKIRES